MSEGTEAVRGYFPKSATVEWGTPPDLFEALNRELGPFDLDAAASDENHLAPAWFTVKDDGLSKAWWGRVWCNPPYGRELRRWTAKATLATHHLGKAELVAMLLPARTDTRWFHETILVPNAIGGPSEVRFLRGRLKFGGARTVAPFASMVVIWRKSATGRR
jgi:site-specific DNA-methyltransferase (adenine-specific)